MIFMSNSFNSDNRFKTCLGLCFGKRFMEWKKILSQTLPHVVFHISRLHFFLIRERWTKKKPQKSSDIEGIWDEEEHFFSERYVYARWLKDFFLMDFEWYMETIYVHARVRLSWNVFEERIKHEWTRRDAVTRTNFERVESSCSWIIDYESHIFPRDHRKKKIARFVHIRF